MIFSGIISQQGQEEMPKLISLRVLFLTGFIFGMLCFISFSANIVTTLSTVQRLETLDQLMNHQPMTFMLSTHPGFQDPVMNSNHDYAKRIGQSYSQGDLHLEIHLYDSGYISSLKPYKRNSFE